VPRTALPNPKTRHEEEEEQREEIEIAERGGTGGEGNPVQCPETQVLRAKYRGPETQVLRACLCY
jgi:hypothetical protein